jgi:hypothetical protein
MNLLPGSPNADSWRKMFVFRIFFYIPPGVPRKHGLLIKQNLTFLSKSLEKKPSIHVPPTAAPMETAAMFPEPIVHSFISPYNYHSPQLRTSPMKEAGKHMVTIRGAPHGQNAYIQRGAAWFIVCYQGISTPVPCSLQHNTFHLVLGRLEPHWPACV